MILEENSLEFDENNCELLISGKKLIDSKINVINRLGIEDLNKEKNIINEEIISKDNSEKGNLKEINPYFVLETQKIESSELEAINEIIETREIDILENHAFSGDFYSINNQLDENEQIQEVYPEEFNTSKINLEQSSILNNTQAQTNYGYYNNQIQNNDIMIIQPQYYHQVRSSGLDKFTAVDRNGKRSILQEVETQAQLMPSIPGVYFDRRQIGYRVRYHNSYVGWVALSRHSSIKDAYEYAKQLWLKARNKSKFNKYTVDRFDLNLSNNSNEKGDLNFEKRIKYEICNESDLNTSIICKPDTNEQNDSYLSVNHLKNDQLFTHKYFNDISYNCRSEEYINSILDSNYENNKPILNQYRENGRIGINQYSALETMRKLYFATQEYVRKWPSKDGHYTIYWSNTSDLSLYLYGESCETHEKKEFFGKKIRNSNNYSKNEKKNSCIEKENSQPNLDIDKTDLSKKQIDNFNYLW